MTRKHFEIVARILRLSVERARESNNDAGVTVLFETAIRFAAEFSHINVRFNRARFLRACGFLET